ncbi:MAG: hypothetical protein R8M70_01480 [Alphaproteobacteria bacterium]|nr:hypothetical protein [Alphaproteobacteria bacterium]
MATILERNKQIKAPKKTRAEHMEDALYREVWEDVNNEKTLQFIKKYSKHITVVVLLIMIAATSVQLGLRTYRANKIATATAYEMAIENMDANALAALADDTSGATADLALFQSYLLDKDVAKLEKLASDGNTRDFRDLARLHIVGIRGDDMSADEMKKFLGNMDDKSSPFYYTTRITLAQKYLASGNKDAADEILDALIGDKNTPSAIAATAATLR